MSKHKDTSIENSHFSHRWEYDNATQREAATGFVSDDVGLLAYQLDIYTTWRLTSITPITWRTMNGDVDHSGEISIAEAHVITAGEVTTGFFTLSQNAAVPSSVRLRPENGPHQNNKQAVGATGIIPDFDCLSNNQIHFNNNGATTGLSEILELGEKVIVNYSH